MRGKWGGGGGSKGAGVGIATHLTHGTLSLSRLKILMTKLVAGPVTSNTTQYHAASNTTQYHTWYNTDTAQHSRVQFNTRDQPL